MDNHALEEPGSHFLVYLVLDVLLYFFLLLFIVFIFLNVFLYAFNYNLCSEL